MAKKKFGTGEIAESGLFVDEEEEFDYILTPKFICFMIPAFMPAVLAFLPFVLHIIAPEFYGFLGLSPSGFFLFMLGAVPGAFNFVFHEVKRRNVRLKLHIDYLVYERGIFFKSVDKVYFEDIKNIKVVTSLSDRFCGTGTLAIATAGTSGFEVVVGGFGNPVGIMRYISVHRKEGE